MVNEERHKKAGVSADVIKVKIFFTVLSFWIEKPLMVCTYHKISLWLPSAGDGDGGPYSV